MSRASSLSTEALRASRPRKQDGGSDANIRNFAPVARIMKTALPENAKIAKEAKECMQECVSEFISFITSEGRSCVLVDVVVMLNRVSSIGKVPSGKEKNGQWRRHPVRHDLARIRELCRGFEDLPRKVPRSEFVCNPQYPAGDLDDCIKLLAFYFITLCQTLTYTLFVRRNLPVEKTSQTDLAATALGQQM